MNDQMRLMPLPWRVSANMGRVALELDTLPAHGDVLTVQLQVRVLGDRTGNHKVDDAGIFTDDPDRIFDAALLSATVEVIDHKPHEVFELEWMDRMVREEDVRQQEAR